MPCFKPWEKEQPKNSGLYLKLPCGQCIGCRTDRKTEWAMRLTHESRLHKQSCFVTLTYSDEHLPRGGTLVKRHLQLFMYRLRQYLKPSRIRFFAVGEYGDQTQRPHYHLILFGWWPPDQKAFSTTGPNPLYISDILTRLWGKGHASFGYADPPAMSYVAHYTVKKITGPMAREHYTRITLDGEMIEVLPEFAHMSTRPGIGAGFHQQYRSDLRNYDHGMHNGKKAKIPRYYDKLMEREDAKAIDKLKYQRQVNARKHRANNTPDRLAVREKVASAKRDFNNGRKSTF